MNLNVGFHTKIQNTKMRIVKYMSVLMYINMESKCFDVVYYTFGVKVSNDRRCLARTESYICYRI